MSLSGHSRSSFTGGILIKAGHQVHLLKDSELGK